MRVSLQTDSADPNPANNTSTNTVTVVAPAPDGDTDADGLPNGWESDYGLDPLTGDAGADPDGDGRTNQQEYQQGTHPRGFVITYFAEGATGSFFDTVIAVANPAATRALVLTRFQREDGAVIRKYQVVEAHSRATIVVEQIPGMASAAFSTLIEADVQVVADRTMSWDSTGYGGHAERGTLTRATSTWYLAEGATHGSFDLFYLIQNPGDVATTVEVKFLRPAPKAPVIKQYPLGPQSRFTLPWTRFPSSRPSDLSAVVRSTDGAPIVVERAMYSSLPGQAVRRRPQQRRRDGAGDAVVPRRGRDRIVLRSLRAHREPEQRGGRGRRGVPADQRHGGAQALPDRGQQPLHDVGEGRGPAAPRRGALDHRHVRQRRADRRRTGDVVAEPGSGTRATTRRARRRRGPGGGSRKASRAVRATSRPTSSWPTPPTSPGRRG